MHEHDVCCLVPENAEPVGILPTPKSSRCGKKGKDTGKEGEAEIVVVTHEVQESDFQRALAAIKALGEVKVIAACLRTL